jgi:hypothetical protein
VSVVSQTYPITVNNQRIVLNPPQQPTIYFKSMAIYNASGYLLTVNLPDGSQDFLNPSTAALFALTGNGTVNVIAGAIAGFTLPTNNVWAVFYDSTDTPGVFPVALPAPGTIGVVTISGQPISVDVDNFPSNQAVFNYGKAGYVAASNRVYTFTYAEQLFVPGGGGVILWDVDLSLNTGEINYGQVGISGGPTLCGANSTEPSDHWHSARGLFVSNGVQIVSFTSGAASSGWTASFNYDQL